jgi:homoserine kinase type II
MTAMAVYTQVSQSQVEMILESYSLGQLSALHEISGGIENTNYFLDIRCTKDHVITRYVMTIFEEISEDELPFFNELTSHLARKGFKVPAPVMNSAGEAVFVLDSKPGMIVQCMTGRDTREPALEQCVAMAEYLANIHLALRDFPRRRSLARDDVWMDSQLALLKNSDIPSEDLGLLERSISRYKNKYSAELQECPQGIVHGDLFRDNVLFNGSNVSGVIDFYHACQATILFDLAVMVNDWAWDSIASRHVEGKVNAITKSYQSVRPWTDQEQRLWPRCLEVAALRFWISRLVSFYLPGYQKHSVEGDTAKDPDEMKAILLRAQEM